MLRIKLRWRLIAWSVEMTQKINRLVMQSKCSVWGIKKSGFVKEQEAKGS